MIECTRGIIIERLGFCIVIGLHILLELILQGILLIQEYGVGNVQRHRIIYLWQTVNQLLAVVVNSLYASLMEA